MATTTDAALYPVLAAATALTSLLTAGQDGGPGIYAIEAPAAAAMPFLLYQVIATSPATTHGEGGTDSRLDGVTVQLTAIADTQLKAAAILLQARLALEASTLKAVMTGEQSLERDEEANAHGRTADFQIWNYPDA